MWGMKLGILSRRKKSKIKVIAVSWGFNSAEILQEYQPNFLINHPRDLLMVIDEDVITV